MGRVWTGRRFPPSNGGVPLLPLGGGRVTSAVEVWGAHGSACLRDAHGAAPGGACPKGAGRQGLEPENQRLGEDTTEAAPLTI